MTVICQKDIPICWKVQLLKASEGPRLQSDSFVNVEQNIG